MYRYRNATRTNSFRLLQAQYRVDIDIQKEAGMLCEGGHGELFYIIGLLGPFPFPFFLFFSLRHYPTFVLYFIIRRYFGVSGTVEIGRGLVR